MRKNYAYFTNGEDLYQIAEDGSMQSRNVQIIKKRQRSSKRQ